MNRSARLLKACRHFLLTLCLLLLQQTSVLHAFQHARAHDEAPAQHNLCKECLAFSALDHAVASTPVVATLVVSHGHSQPDLRQAQCHEAVALAYLSRAPPRLSSLA